MGIIILRVAPAVCFGIFCHLCTFSQTGFCACSVAFRDARSFTCRYFMFVAVISCVLLVAFPLISHHYACHCGVAVGAAGSVPVCAPSGRLFLPLLIWRRLVGGFIGRGITRIWAACLRAAAGGGEAQGRPG